MATGRTDKEKLAALLTGTLPQSADGEQAGVYGKIDYGLLGRALAGVPAAQAAQVREACAR